MERQTEPPINPKVKKKKKKEEKRENQKTTMACICIEMKERIEREKEKAYLKEKKMENATVRVTGEESRPAECSERMEGNFLRKGKRKLSQKDEKRKREMEKF